MLMMRLQRIGRRNEPHYRVVVIEKSKGPKSQKYVDIVGSYNPKMGTVTMKEDKAKKWLENGVQPSDTVYNMLVTKGLIEGRKKNVLPKKSPVIDHEKIEAEKKAAEEKAQAEADAKAAAEAEKEAAEAPAEEAEAPAEETAPEATEPEDVAEEAAPEAEVSEEVKEEETKTEA